MGFWECFTDLMKDDNLTKQNQFTIDQSYKVFDLNKGKQVITFRTMAMVSKEELIATLNKHNTKPKMKAKILNELTKRGVKLVWK